jgi:hypothetical protein
MKKTLLICMALLFALCVGNLNAQEAKKSIPGQMSQSVLTTASRCAIAASNYTPPQTRDVVYTEGFEGTTGETLPTGWTTAGGTWQTMYNASELPLCGDPMDPHGGSRMVGRSWAYSGNYWLFSAGFQLTAGTAYLISYWWSAPGWPNFGETDDHEMRIGMTPTATGMASAFLVFKRVGVMGPSYPNYGFAEATNTFTPTESGTYYLGLHDLTPEGEGLWIIIDDVTVSSTGPAPDPCPAVNNVTATQFEANKVKVNWTAPTVTEGLANYKIYEGNTEKGTVPAGTTTWTSDPLANGTYTFGVSAIYGTDCAPVKVVATPIEIKTCDTKVTNVAAAYASDCSKSTVTWTAPGKTRDRLTGWLTWIVGDDVSGYVGYSSDAGADMTCAHRFTPADLQASGVENGQKITKIGLGMGTQLDQVQVMEIKIWEGGTSVTDPGTLKYTQAVTGFASFPEATMKEIELTTPYTIDASKELRIGWRIDSRAGNGGYPLGADAWMAGGGTAVPQKGTLIISPDPILWGGQWVCVVSQLGWSANFSIKAYVEGTSGPIELKYNVYRDEEKLTTTPLVDITTFDDTEFDKTKPHKWSVAVVCPNGGDGDWVGVDKDACYTLPCNPVTNPHVTFQNGNQAKITWTASENAIGYEVTRDGNTQTVTTTEYIETFDFVDGTEYTWTIVTVCENGKSDPATAQETFVGINDINLPAFSIAPNPATNEITIKAGFDFNKVEVINYLGQSVISQNVINKMAKVDISTLTNGIYFVRITSENGISVQKFVKN